MKKLLLVYILTFSLACGRNNSAEIEKHNIDSIEYVQKSIDFIKVVKGKDLNDSTFVLEDKPFAFNYFDCLNQVLADSSTFTNEELKLIKQKKYVSVAHWNKSFFPNIKFVRRTLLDSIFSKNFGGWSYYKSKIGDSFNSFSMPIFLRNYTYCLFYSDNSCGGLCGGGRLILYRRNNGTWEEIVSYCNWIS